MRTIKQFISNINHVYFYMKDSETCKKFYRDAEAEGILFGKTLPTKKETSDIIALQPDGTICYVGWAGRTCYCHCRKGVTRIDYDKYSSGCFPYLIR